MPSELIGASAYGSQSKPIILKTAVISVNNSENTKKANLFIYEGSFLYTSPHS